MIENRGAHKRRQVYCYELDKTFNTIKEASLETKVPTGQISTTCQGRQKTAKGLTFCYAENKTNLNLQEFKTHKAHRQVYCYELNKVFANAREAAKELGITDAGIRQVCTGNHNTHMGYKWCFAENINTTNWNEKKSTHERAVYCYETDTTYNSILECATATNSNLTSVRKACAGTMYIVNGMRFCYAEYKDTTDWDSKEDRSNSTQQQQLHALLSPFVDVRINDRTVLKNGTEIDLFIYNHNVGVEFNGLYWHQDKIKGTTKYHYNKTCNAHKQGIKLIQIFEHQINEDNKELWRSTILAKCGIFDNKLYARKTTIREITSSEASKFLNKNHLQGNQKSATVKLGLFHDDKLTSVMTFGKPRFNKNHEWELYRFCSKQNTIIVGGASKLLKYFETRYNPTSMVSYANLQWSDGKLYEKLGFNLLDTISPSYWWCRTNSVLTRYQTQKHKLSKLFDDVDMSLTETEIMESKKYYKVHDCGSLTFVKTYK